MDLKDKDATKIVVALVIITIVFLGGYGYVVFGDEVADAMEKTTAEQYEVLYFNGMVGAWWVEAGDDGLLSFSRDDGGLRESYVLKYEDGYEIKTLILDATADNVHFHLVRWDDPHCNKLLIVTTERLFSTSLEYWFWIEDPSFYGPSN